jgi:uncharacterized protein (DUF342 family)
MEFLGKVASCKKCGDNFTVTFEDQALDKEETEAVSKEDLCRKKEAHSEGKRTKCPVIFRLAMNYKLCTEEQIKNALSEMGVKNRNGRRLLSGEILVNRGLINEAQFKSLLSIRRYLKISHLDKKFGGMAMEIGLVSRQEVERSIEEQKIFFQENKQILPIGDILVNKKAISEENRISILEKQHRLRPLHSEDGGEKGKNEESGKADDLLSDIFIFTISPDESEVKIAVVGKAVPDDLTVQEIKDFLESKGIKQGVKSDLLIEEFINEELESSEPWIIAEGTPPTAGKDAEIKYSFDTDPLKAGKIREDGSIDFNERQVIPQVSKGDIVAEKIPPIKGEDGTSIYGTPIAASEVSDIVLQKGQGVKISEDGLKIFADIDGMPSVSSDGVVTVSPILDIKGDVGIKTGNIDFEGAVRVSGSIEKGFYVKCHSLTALDIEETRIEAEGDVAVFNGMIGSNIAAGGNVSAKYIRGTKINTAGNVVAEREIIDSDIQTTGACIVERGQILHSSVIAKNGIQAVHIGSEKTKPSSLVVGIDYKVKKTIEDLRHQITEKNKGKGKLKTLIDKLTKEYALLDEKIGESAQEQDKIIREQLALKKKQETAEEGNHSEEAEELQKSIDEIEVRVGQLSEGVEGLIEKQGEIWDEIEEHKNELKEARNQLEEISGEISRLTEDLKSDSGKPVVKVSGTIFSRTLIEGPRSSCKLDGDFNRVAVTELKIDEPDSTPRWEMKITPLK